MTDNPMCLVTLMNAAPRCGARTRSGTPCQAPAIRGKERCRLHGGRSPGAPKGEMNGNYRHGRYTREMLAERRQLTELLRESRELLSRVR
jgi:hypothetical protein